MVEKLTDAGFDFATGTYKGIAKGFYDIGDFVLDIPHTIQNCPHVADDADSWSTLGASFKDFSTFCTTVSQNVLLNYTEIMSEIDAANKGMAAGDWWEFSFRSGIIADEIIQPAILDEKVALE